MGKFIENYFGPVLFTTLGLGVAIPAVGRIPSPAVIIILAFVMFMACFRIEPSQLKRVRVLDVGFYLLFRCLLFPGLVYLLVRNESPEIAAGALLIAACPAGAVSPAFVGLLGGNTALALLVLVISTLLAPLTIPLVLRVCLNTDVGINLFFLFRTLVLTIFVPVLFYFLLRNRSGLRSHLRTHGSWMSILCVSFTVMIVASKQREYLLAGTGVARSLVILTLIFVTCYLVGWMGHLRSGSEEKIALAVCSGANNIGLGISLALLYFPPEVTTFMVLGELPWILLLIPLKRWRKTSYLGSSSS